MRMSGLLFTQWRELWISWVPAWQSEVDPVLESSDVRPQTISPLPFNFAQYLIRMVRKGDNIVEGETSHLHHAWKHPSHPKYKSLQAPS